MGIDKVQLYPLFFSSRLLYSFLRSHSLIFIRFSVLIFFPSSCFFHFSLSTFHLSSVTSSYVSALSIIILHVLPVRTMQGLVETTVWELSQDTIDKGMATHKRHRFLHFILSRFMFNLHHYPSSHCSLSFSFFAVLSISSFTLLEVEP